MKKLLLPLAAAISLFSPSLWAAPLQRSQVAADAKWVLHLDMESFQKSKTGSSLLQLALNGLMADMRNMPIDIAEVIAKTASVTVYGADFKPGPNGRGVLIWKGSKEVEQAVTGLLVQQAEASKAGQGSVRFEREGSDPIYSVGGQVFINILAGGGILVSPRFAEIDEACRVLGGKSPSLEANQTYSEYTVLPGGFFFLALAEGFARDAGLPAQAEVLKQAEGGRLALGEEDDQLKLSVNLKAQNAEGALQIQQVLQGLVALASLAKVDEPQLMQMKEWMRSARVASDQNIVSFDLSIPVEEALKQLKNKVGVHHSADPATAVEQAQDAATTR